MGMGERESTTVNKREASRTSETNGVVQMKRTTDHLLVGDEPGSREERESIPLFIRIHFERSQQFHSVRMHGIH
jgi:hypothetical protein